jgi:hypothetical protein
MSKKINQQETVHMLRNISCGGAFLLVIQLSDTTPAYDNSEYTTRAAELATTKLSRQ